LPGEETLDALRWGKREKPLDESADIPPPNTFLSVLKRSPPGEKGGQGLKEEKKFGAISPKNGEKEEITSKGEKWVAPRSNLVDCSISRTNSAPRGLGPLKKKKVTR